MPATFAEEKPKPEGKKLSSGQAARIIGVSSQTVREYGERGLLDRIDVGVDPDRRRPTYRFFLSQVQWFVRSRDRSNAA